MDDWKVYRGTHEPHTDVRRLPPPPPWRNFRRLAQTRGRTFQASPRETEVVNAALYLRRPLLVTGAPGTGKSSLAYGVALELGLGEVLRWSINSRSILAEGLYQYDALARLRDSGLARQRREGDAGATPERERGIGSYLRLGPLGTALLPRPQPRVLLIDEIDKSDIDLPNDLLHVFEEGSFEIPELLRIAEETPEVEVLTAGEGEGEQAVIRHGKVCCEEFPFVVLTSNGERELPPAFLRRCLRLDLAPPGPDRLRQIVQAHLEGVDLGQVESLLRDFTGRRDEGLLLATDQLLNAVFLVTQGQAPEGKERQAVLDVLLRELGRT